MSTNEDFLASLDSEKSRQIVAALDHYKSKHGINQELTAAEVVDAARDPKSVLHKYFDWNDKSAAHKHRVDTARRLISSVRFIVQESGKVTYRAFTSVKPSKADDRRYERVSRVLNDEALQIARLRDFQASLAGLLSQYADIDQRFLEPVKSLRDEVTVSLQPQALAAE